MVRLYRANVDNLQNADIVVVGVPDESKSHAKRKGTSRAPDVLRIASNETEFFERGGKIIPICPMRGSLEDKHIFDAGNVSGKQELIKLVSMIVSAGKLPIMIGGDHSLTTDTIKIIAAGKKLSLLYFDAHPDFVSSTRNYYGSILTDSAESIYFRKSIQIGIRAAEPEELINAQRVGLKIITPLDVAELGVKKVSRMIRDRTAGSRIYISIDLDCVDPASAPGVSVPSPGGLAAMDLIYMLNKVISGGNIVGIDIVELTPDYDVNGMTSALAARILSECIASIQ